MDLPDFQDPQDVGLSVIISGASAPAPLPSLEHAVVVVPDTSTPEIDACAAKLARKLQKKGTQVTVSSLSETKDMELENQSCLCLVDARKDMGFLPDISESNWESLKRVIFTCRDVTYVTRGGTVNSENPSTNLMTGMARSIRSEEHALLLTTVDLGWDTALDDDENIIAPLLKIFQASSVAETDEKWKDREYAIRDGIPKIQRVLLEENINELAATWYATPKPKPGTLDAESQGGQRRLTLTVGTPGRLDTLRFKTDDQWTNDLAPHEVEIEVKAAGLNFKDIMVAMGQLAQPALGVECAGVIRRVGKGVTHLKEGDAVMTRKLDTFSNIAQAPAAMVQPISELSGTMEWATAASLPVIYSTAHYALSTTARL